MKKKACFALYFAILLSLNLISAMNIEVTSKTISDSAIIDLNKPAVFDITIKNLGETSNFEIYSLIGMDITPKQSYLIATDSEKTIRIEIMPQESLKQRKGRLAFEYEIKNSKNEIKKAQLSVDILDLESSFSLTPKDLNIDSQNIQIDFKNRAMYSFDNVKVKMKSLFFEYENTFSFKDFETKSLTIPIDKDKLKKLGAGNYLIECNIEANGESAKKEVTVRYVENDKILASESERGTIIHTHEIKKENIGNLPKTISASSEQNLFFYLFTTVSPKPTEFKINGFNVQYTWEKNLAPGEILDILITTNWFYPFIVIILIIVVIIFIRKSIEMDIIFRKNVSFVKTRGGEFALKVVLRVKGKRAVEKITIIDRLPNLVSLYEKFGTISPDKVDIKNKKLEWNLMSLNKGEERVFSYIIYSKVGIIGRFELPAARAVYDREGKIKQINSNRSFFVNKQKADKL